MKHTCKVTTISVSLLNPSCVEVVLRPKLGLPHRARARQFHARPTTSPLASHSQLCGPYICLRLFSMKTLWKSFFSVMVFVGYLVWTEWKCDRHKLWEDSV